MSKAQVLPVCIISGDELFLVRRFKTGYVKAMEDQGWSLEIADASEPGSVSLAMDGNLFMESTKTLVVVLNPHKGDLSLYEEHSKEKKPDTVLALYYEGKPKGNTKWGKFVKEHAKAHASFVRPERWNLEDYAVKFLSEEIVSLGKRFEHPSLPKAIVERVGTDLGVLYFEALKMSLLCEEGTITVGDVKGALAEMMEASMQPVIESLAARNKQKLLKALGRVKDTTKGDPTIKVARILEARVLQWFQVSFFKDTPPQAASEELGIHPWVIKNTLPIVRRWNQRDLIHLIKALALSERALFSGHVSPWVGMVARLAECC